MSPSHPWSLRLAGAALVFGLCGYALTGDLRGWRPIEAPQPAALMVEQLAARLAAAGPGQGSAQDWAMLGRSQAVLGELGAARQAYEQALRRQPDDPDLMTEYADVLASAQAGVLQGEPSRWIDRALARDAQHPKALALAATRAWQQGDRQAARAAWQRLRRSAPADHPLSDWAARQLQQLALADSAAAAGGDSAPR